MKPVPEERPQAALRTLVRGLGTDKRLAGLPASGCHESGPQVHHGDVELLGDILHSVGVGFGGFSLPADLVHAVGSVVLLTQCLVDWGRRDEDDVRVVLLDQRVRRDGDEIPAELIQRDVLPRARGVGQARVVGTEENRQEAYAALARRRHNQRELGQSLVRTVAAVACVDDGEPADVGVGHSRNPAKSSVLIVAMLGD